MFCDVNKFKKLSSDPTLTRLNTVQSYLRTLNKRGELTDAELMSMKPRNAKPARAHLLPKIHKDFDVLPSFRPIIDTTGTTHCYIGKFLSQLIFPLTTNEFTLKDSYDAANRIRAIPPDLFNDYKYVSFDVVSLFTNVPLDRTINIILDRIYNENAITTKLERRTLKKLIIDTCTKTAFSANGNLYEQIDGVSMGSSLGPVLANIIMTELEKHIIQPLIDQGIIKFYCRFVDDTLLLVKPADIGVIHERLNSFDPNLRFTVDIFDTAAPHFLDLSLSNDTIKIHHKPTNTGVYINYDSFTPWAFRVSWINSLLTRAKRLCSPTALKDEILFIKKLASWNGFPKWIVNKLVDNILNSQEKEKPIVEDDVITLWFRCPFLGNKGNFLTKSVIRKIKRYCNKDITINFKILHDTTKVSFFTNTKDRTPFLNQSFIVYEFVCPGCKSTYIGKTERTLHHRSVEHAWSDKNSAVKQHIDNCDGVHFINSLLSMDLTPSDNKTALRDSHVNCVQNAITVIDRSNNWNILLFKESIAIKKRSPVLNNGVKASKDLQLF
jgi:hypothetical protein